jgi:hypothetical protein
MGEKQQFKLTELVIDPPLQLLKLQLGDGTINVLRITHPRHGELDFQIPHEDLDGIIEAFTRLKGAASTALQ